MAVQPRVVLRVVVVLAFLGILLAGSLAPGWFTGGSDPLDTATTTTEPGPPSTTLVPVDIRPAPPTSDPPVAVHIGTMLDGGMHVLRPDPPAVLFIGGIPLEIRRIDGLAANGDCAGLRTALDRWLPMAELLDEVDLVDDGQVDDGQVTVDALETARAASVFARAAFDALVGLDCG